jgi:Undecaprenyl-phosphate glucose phosphotransferase
MHPHCQQNTMSSLQNLDGSALRRPSSFRDYRSKDVPDGDYEDLAPVSEAAQALQQPIQQTPRTFISPPVIAGLYTTLELAGLVATVVTMTTAASPIPVAMVTLCAIVVLLLTTTSSVLGAFAPQTLAKLRSSVPRGFLYVGVSFGSAVLAIALTRGLADFPKHWLSTTIVWSLALAVVGRSAVFLAIKALTRRGHLEHRLAVVGGGELGQRLMKRLGSAGDPSLKLVGFFDDRASRVPEVVDGTPYLGKLDEIAGWVRDQRIQTVIVALPWSADARIHQIRERLGLLPVDIRLSPDQVGFSIPDADLDTLAGLPMLGVGAKPITEWAALAKRAEDIVLSAVFLTLLIPLFAVIALLVRLDSPGPIFFRQKRTGYSGRLIEVIKFRTIKVEHTDANAERLVSKNDSRVTRVGRVLRKSSLDELPQLINVLRGDMSIVGPRPHPLSAKAAGWLYPDVVEDYAARHKVKPGITGWAQVNGWRGETDSIEKIQNRVAHDLYYIDNWSLWLDLKILARTVIALTTAERAY